MSPGKIFFILIVSLFVSAAAQEPGRQPTSAEIYCSGILTSDPIPTGTILISGEESGERIVYDEGNFVYLNRGAKEGVHSGDEFLVMRPLSDPMGINWYRGQNLLIRSLGTVWEDEGRLRVTSVFPRVSIARVEESCNYMQRGDIAVPFAARPAPLISQETALEGFEAPGGKAETRVVMGKDFKMILGTNDIAYIDAGREQGLHPGDTVRFLRYAGRESEIPYRTSAMSFRVQGYGRGPRGYNWLSVPAEVIGEGTVLRTGSHTASVLVTFSYREIYAGDSVDTARNP